jgi:hypothetical protein
MREQMPVPKTLRLWLAAAIIGIGLIFVFVVFQASRSYELTDSRAMDQGQIARNIARGAGFTTDLIRPLTLAHVPQIDNHPDLIQAPLHPFFMSLLFRAFGPSSRVISWSSGIPFLLTMPLVLWIGWVTFSRKVGMLAIVAVATNVSLLFTAVSGTEGALLGWMFTALALVCLYHSRLAGKRILLSALAGALAALCYLTSYVWILALPAVALVLLLNSTQRQRGKVLTVFLLAFIVVTLPWGVRNWRVSGTPFPRYSVYEVVQGTRTFSGNTLYRSYESAPPSVLSFMLSAPREIYQKAHDNALSLYPMIFALAGAVIMPFFVVATLIPLGVGGIDPGIDRLRLGIYATLFLVFTALCLSIADGRLMTPLVPVISVVAAAFFYQLLDLRLRGGTPRVRTRWTNLAVGLLLVLHGLPLFLQLAPGRPTTQAAPLAIRRASDELNALIRELSGGSESTPGPVYTDLPWAVAWYADRPSIWLPRTDIDQRRIEQNVGQVRWLVLTPQVSDVAEPEKAQPWADIWRRSLTERGTIGGWRVRQRFANGAWVLLERVPDVASVGGIGPSGAAPAPAALAQ